MIFFPFSLMRWKWGWTGFGHELIDAQDPKSHPLLTLFQYFSQLLTVYYQFPSLAEVKQNCKVIKLASHILYASSSPPDLMTEIFAI